MKNEIGFKERMHKQQMKEISKNARQRKAKLEAAREYASYPSAKYCS